MLTWDDIRAIDAISDPSASSIYADRPEESSGRLVRAVSLAGELRRLEAGMAADHEVVTAYRRRIQDLRPALARMLEGARTGAGAVHAALDRGGLRVGVGMPVGMAVVVEETAYVAATRRRARRGPAGGRDRGRWTVAAVARVADGRDRGGRHVPVVGPARYATCAGAGPRGADGRARAGLDAGRRCGRRPACAHPGEVGDASGG